MNRFSCRTILYPVPPLQPSLIFAADYPVRLEPRMRSETKYLTYDRYLLFIQDPAAYQKVVSQIDTVTVQFPHCGIQD